MTVQQATENLAVLFLLCGISFWGSIVFSTQTRPRLQEGWGWMQWRPLPRDMGTVLFGAFALSLLVQVLVSPLLLFTGDWPASLQIALTLLLYQGLISVVVYRHLHRNRISESDVFGMEPGLELHDIAWGVAGYCMVIPFVGLSVIGSELLFEVMGWEFNLQPTVELISGETSLGNSLLLFLLIGFVGPFLEEVIFRGVLFPVMVNACGRMCGLVLQGLIFAIVHLHAGSLLPLWVLGIILGFLYIHTRRMMVCVWTHACFNSVTLIMYLPMFSGGAS